MLGLLAHVYYQHAAVTPDGPEKERLNRQALESYVLLEKTDQMDSDHYERLTELAHLLGEEEMFTEYAQKHASKFPGDRKAYNLGLAQFQSGDFARVIESQKAIEEYPLSPFVGGFYRLLGDAYLSVDRQQTAERTYEEGVGVAEQCMRDLLAAEESAGQKPGYRQLLDSRKAMLLSLKKIYRIHGKNEKMKEADRADRTGCFLTDRCQP